MSKCSPIAESIAWECSDVSRPDKRDLGICCLTLTSRVIYIYIYLCVRARDSLSLSLSHSVSLNMYCGCPRGVMVKVLVCGIVVSEFELQSRYYIHFRTNNLGKGMNSLSSQLWVKLHDYCSSRRMTLALNNLVGWYAIKQRNNTEPIWIFSLYKAGTKILLRQNMYFF